MSHRKPRTVVRKPHLDRMCKRWNQQQLEALYRLESTGAPLADLAVITGRTQDAIRQQLAIMKKKLNFSTSFMDDVVITEGSPRGDQS